LIYPTVRLSTEQQVRLGLAGALDAGPAVVRIGALQVGQIIIDGVSVDIDEAWVGGLLSVDDGGSAQRVRRAGATEVSYCECTIQDVYA
jgi:hypothetical protein